MKKMTMIRKIINILPCVFIIHGISISKGNKDYSDIKLKKVNSLELNYFKDEPNTDISPAYQYDFPNINKKVFSRKKYHTISGKTVAESFDIDGNVVNLDNLIDLEKKKYKEKFGNLSTGLVDHINDIEINKINEKTRVTIWFDETKINFPMKYSKMEKNTDELGVWEEKSKDFRLKHHAKSLKKINKIIDELSDTDLDNELKIKGGNVDGNVQVFKFFPYFRAELSVKQLKQLRNNPNVSFVELHYPGAIEYDLADAAYVMNVDDMHYHGYNGTNVKLATWHANTNNFVSQMGTPTYRQVLTTEDQHLTYMISSIRNNRTIPSNGTGFAPGANLFVANYTGWDSYASADPACEWAVEEGVVAMNQSWHYTAEQTDGNMSQNDKQLDYMTTHYPYTMAVQAAGNQYSENSGEFVNHKGYNQLVVGQDLQNSTMAPTSVWRNPNSGQELPHITAGVDYSMSMMDEIPANPGTANGATSVAAAIMTGFVGSLHEVNSSLSYWPEAVRAIVMASGDNIVGGDWYSDKYVDGKDGAGRANGYEAKLMAQNQLNSGTGSNFGFKTGSFGSTGSLISFDINVTELKNVQIILSWTAQVSGTNFSITDLSDLDLQIYKGSSYIGGSYQTSDPIEGFTINAASSGTGIYTIKINPFSLKGNFTYYSVAWANR